MKVNISELKHMYILMLCSREYIFMRPACCRRVTDSLVRKRRSAWRSKGVGDIKKFMMVHTTGRGEGGGLGPDYNFGLKKLLKVQGVH